MAKAHPDKRVVTYFQDEARYGQKGTITRCWAKRGSRPTAVRQNQYDYLYVYGAVCPATGDSKALIAPAVDTEIMSTFLRLFGESLPTDVHAVMILDQAGWHTSKKLGVPPNVTLLYLPPRSPQLNPTENLWHWITANYWSNRTHGRYEEMVPEMVGIWNKTASDTARIKTVCAAPYLSHAA